MRKVASIFLLAVLIVSLLPVSAAATEDRSFEFELTVDGSETKNVSTGDIITVVLHLKRTDRDESYTMYAMQDEIRYDSQYFELVEGSAVLIDGVVHNDIGMRDRYREFYINFLSSSGGAAWEPDMLIGSFQLRVIATSGVTKITNQDYLVSAKDGFSSFPCSANELTIIVSTECTVRFESNGGSQIKDQLVHYGEKITRPEDPVRDGYTFAGWYSDIDKTIPWDFDNDTVSGNMVLYAKWTEGAELPATGEPPGEDGSNLWWLIPAGILLLVIIILLLWPQKNVHFDSTGGTEVKAKRVLKNGKIKKPRAPRLRGQTFGGWYKDAACTIPWNFETDKVTDDITLYAKWHE